MRWLRWVNSVGATTPKINVVKTGNILKIYVPSQTDPNRYLCFYYERLTNASVNQDAWLQTQSGVYSKSGSTYTLQFNLATSGDQEGVLQVSGQSDFIGGRHGYETNLSLDVIIDGNTVSMASDFNVVCSHVKITNLSEVYNDGTTVKAFTRYKVSTWDINLYTIESRWIAEVVTDIVSAKLCQFAVDKASNGRNVLNWGRTDYQYQKVDVSQAFAAVRGIGSITKQELWSAEQDFYIGLSCDYDREKYPTGEHYIQDFTTRAKIYFDFGVFTMQVGEALRTKNYYDFRF